MSDKGDYPEYPQACEGMEMVGEVDTQNSHYSDSTKGISMSDMGKNDTPQGSEGIENERPSLEFDKAKNPQGIEGIRRVDKGKNLQGSEGIGRLDKGKTPQGSEGIGRPSK